MSFLPAIREIRAIRFQGRLILKILKPLFFKQQRPGLNGKPFEIYKFRTMTDRRDETGNLLQEYFPSSVTATVVPFLTPFSECEISHR